MDPQLVDIGLGSLEKFANSRIYDKIYDSIPNPKKRLSNYRARRKSVGQPGQPEQTRDLVARREPSPPPEQNGYGYDGQYDYDYDYDYDTRGRGRDRGARDRGRRETVHFDERPAVRDRRDYLRETPRSHWEDRDARNYELVPYRPRAARTEVPYNRRALSASGLQGRAPFTYTDDYSEDEDEISRSRRDFTRAFVETDAFNDPDPNSPATPSEAYSGHRSHSNRSQRSQGSRRSHPQESYEIVRRREVYGVPPKPPSPEDRPSGGGTKPASEYAPPPYPLPLSARAAAMRENVASGHSPARLARGEPYRDAYDRESHRHGSARHGSARHGSVRSTASRRRRRTPSPQRGGVASAAMGALAGGFLGTELSKGDTLATVAAAVVGAVGAHEAERKYEKFERRRDDRRENHVSWDDDDDDEYYSRRRRRSR